MANNVTSNPLIIDSTGTLVVTGQMNVQKIRWVSPVANKTITLKDRKGAVKFQYVTGAGATPTEPVVVPDSDFNPPLPMDGLTVEDISSAGTVHIYLTATQIPVKTS